MPHAAERVVDPRVRRTRAAVLDVAVELLVESGAAAVTIESVVQRSGVARSTIYRHWARRVDLVADAFTQLMPPLPPVPAGGDLPSRLRAVLSVLAEQIADERYAAFVPAVLASTARDPELAGFRDTFTEAQRAPLATILEAGVRAGELTAELDIDGAVSQLVGPLLFRRVVLAQPIGSADADRTVAMFLRGVTAGAPARTQPDQLDTATPDAYTSG